MLNGGISLSPDATRIATYVRGEILSIPTDKGVTYNLTSSPGTHERNPAWSPDGKKLAYFSDASGEYQVYVMDPNDLSSAKCMTSLKSGYTISSNMYNSFQPIFSDDSKYVFFISSRNFTPSISSVEWNVSYSNDHYVFAIPLSKETPVLTSIKGNNTSEKSVTKSGEIKLDIDGILDRTFVLPLPAAKYSLIACYDNVLYFVKNGKSSKLDLKTMKHSEISKKFIMEFTPDGKKALVNSSGKAYIVNVPSMSGNQDPVAFKNTKVMIDYEKEWKQIFDETWRIYRDYFYVANMHGKDWKAIHDKYAEFLPYVKHRHDLTYIIGEMIAELTVGHAYVSSGQAPRAERIKLGLLGGKFSKTSDGNFSFINITSHSFHILIEEKVLSLLM